MERLEYLKQQDKERYERSQQLAMSKENSAGSLQDNQAVDEAFRSRPVSEVRESPSVEQVEDQEAVPFDMVEDMSGRREGEQDIDGAAPEDPHQQNLDQVAVAAAPSGRYESGIRNAREGAESRSLKSRNEDISFSGQGGEGRAAHRPLRAHQDVQEFLIGIHKSAELEAQLQVQLLKQQEH